MITSFNPNNELYTRLLDKAWEALYKDPEGKLTPSEIAAGKFTSLDQYFSHMKDLVEIDPVYMMIPLDEQTEGIFKINANDRTIAIPAQFNKCAGVQNDNFCEIAVFTIDRYFDFQDLNETQICIQWINANGQEGISHICLRDIETFPGKLRFGWPLTTKITEYAGPVQFAVRFYVSREDKENNTKITYVLNTLQHTITIKPTLNINELSDNVITENISGDIFNYVVKNSQNPSFEIPLTPLFREPGKELVTVAAINETDDSLTLEAQAVASDRGIISYDWKFIPAGAEANSTPVNLKDYSGDNTYIYSAQDVYKPVDISKGYDSSQKYFLDDLNDIGEYVPYYEFKEDETRTVYTKWAQLKINPANGVLSTREGDIKKDNIVGKYYVEATNTTIFSNAEETSANRYVFVPYTEELFRADDREKYTKVDGKYVEATEWDAAKTYYVQQEYVREFTNSTIPSPSAICTVPAPHSIEITKDLPVHQFIGENGFATLDVDVREDETNPSVKYDWRLSTVSGDMEESESKEISNFSEYKTATPGWYKVNITSKLNRKEETAESIVCKVTNQPEAPKTSVEGRDDLGYFYAYTTKINDLQKIHDFIDGTYVSDDDEELVWKSCNLEDDLTHNLSPGSIILMKIVTNLNDDDITSLDTEELQYQWFVQDVDDTLNPGWRELSDEDQDSYDASSLLMPGFDLNTNVLVARLPEERDDNNAYNYACVITNFINGSDNEEKSKLDTRNEYTFTFK